MRASLARCGPLALVVLLNAPPLPAQAGRDTFPWFEKPARTAVFPDIALDPGRLADAIARHRVIAIDLRPEEAYHAGHLPGAVRLDLPAELDLAAVRAALARQGLCGPQLAVLYAESADLLALGHAYLALAAAGYPATRVLPGGYAAWAAAGGASEIAPVVRPACRFELPADPGIVVDRSWLAGHFDRPEIEILDLRDGSGWTGGGLHEAPPLFSSGHVPHSLPLDVAALLPAVGQWPQPVASRRVLGSLAPRPETPVNLDGTFVLYGSDATDERPALAFLLLRSMDVEVKVLTGGFKGWAADPRNPIVRIVSTAGLRSLIAQAGSRPEAPPQAPLIFDLREEWDFRDGHRPGAESLPSHDFAEQLEPRVAQRRPAADRSRLPLVLYCYGRQCIRSRDCATIAARYGFRNILWYRDGIDAWERDGGTVVPPRDSRGQETYRILGDRSKPEEPPPPR